MEHDDRALISIVVPVYNEESNIQPFYEALTSAVAGLNTDFEMVFVDDGSTDHTYALLCLLAGEDCRVRALRFSRNFGSHPALTAGLRHSRGQAAIVISVDLQDPPELIGQFLEHWRGGHHVVWGVRESREDSWTKKTLANLFYAIIRRVALPDYPRQGMDFGLLDRRVIDAVNSFEDASGLVPPTVVWAGFRQMQIPYHRGKRHSGQSKWSLAKRIKAAIDIIVSFSYLPIRLISYLGIGVSLLSFFYGLFVVLRRVFWGLGGAGWPSVLAVVLFLGGLQLFILGILGEYIWRTSEQAKGRPRFLIMEQIGFDTNDRGEIECEGFTVGSRRLPRR